MSEVEIVKFGDGEEGDAIHVGIAESQEPFSEYSLEDGTIIKSKQVITDVVRAVDRFNEDGTPVYLFKFQMVLDVRVPDELRRPV